MKTMSREQGQLVFLKVIQVPEEWEGRDFSFTVSLVPYSSLSIAERQAGLSSALCVCVACV